MPSEQPVVLLLHGQPGAPADWDWVIRELGARASPLALTRPGWAPGTKPTTLEGNTVAAITALDERGVEQAVVVGHSLGGAVAAWLAASHPERTAGLVLIAPAANGESLTAIDRVLAAPVLGEGLSAVSLLTAGAGLALAPARRALNAQLGVDPGYLRSWAPLLRQPSLWRSFAAEQRMLIRELPLLEDRLDRIAAPTAIVAGTADRVVPIEAARRLAQQIPEAELIEIAGAHHLPHRQHAAQVARIILRAAAG